MSLRSAILPRFIAFCVLIALFSSLPVNAQTTPYTGMDVVFLVDQSGSMGGTSFGASAGTTARDPQGLRFYGVEYAFDTLRAYQQSAQNSQMNFRMAVISFGDSLETTLPWTTIDPAASWDTEAERVRQSLAAEAFGARNLGNTDFVSAYEQAQLLFSQLPTGEPRLQVVILLSDGAPCAPRRFSDPNCSNPADQNIHMDDVLALTTTAFPAPDHHLFVIAIDENDQFWSRFAPRWETVVDNPANARRVTTSTEVGQQFLQILTQMIGLLRGDTNTDVIGQEIPLLGTGIPTLISVSPYNQTMRLTIFKSQPNISVFLTDPRNQSISEGVIDVEITGQNTPIETWTITHPQPGNWSLLTSADVSLMDVYLDLLRATWDAEIAQENVTRYLPVDLSLQIVDSQGVPLPRYDDPRYQLNVTVTANGANGAAQQLSLNVAELGGYIGSYIPTQAGITTFDLTATTQNVDGTLLTIINAPDFMSIDAADMTMTVNQAPVERMFISETVTLTAALTDETGQLLQPDGVTIDTTLRGSRDNLTYDLIPAEDGTYTLNLPINEVGGYQFAVRAMYARDDTNRAQIIAEQTLPTFNVNAAQIIGLRLIEPPDQATQYTKEGFPPLTDTNLSIVVRAVNITTENTVDLLALGADPAALPLELTVTSATGETLTPQLQPAEEPGLYRVILPALAEGDYTVSVRPTQMRIGTDGIFNMENTPSAFVRRIANPQVLVFYAGSIFTIVVVLAVIIAIIVQNVRRRSNPASGTLTLVHDNYDDYQRAELWRKSLDGEHSNRIIVTRGLPPEIKRLEITSDASLAGRKEVRVTVTFKGGKTRAFLMRPETEQSIWQDANGALLLGKDTSLT